MSSQTLKLVQKKRTLEDDPDAIIDVGRSSSKRVKGEIEDEDLDIFANEPAEELKDSALVIKIPKREIKFDMVSKMFDEGKKDFSTTDLKKDHFARPLWVSPDGNIFLESFSPIYQQAYDFLIAIAEPVSRPEHIHEYRLTAFSLLAASSVGLQTEDIIDVLNRLSKVPVPEGLISFIRMSGSNYGKLKLVLKEGKYFLESEDPALLQTLLKDSVIKSCRVIQGNEELTLSAAPTKKDLNIPGIPKKDPNAPSTSKDPRVAEDIYEALDLQEEDEDDPIEAKVHSFQVEDAGVETLKHHLLSNNPVVEEYDFKNDRENPNLDIDLKPSTVIRPYQEKSLSKMFGDGRARSGIIVLPCGAGKTLVGITAACTIKKSILILCTSSVSVDQWKQQILMWTTLKESQVSKFTSNARESWHEEKHLAGVTVSTYTMVAYSGKRAPEAEQMMKFLRSTEWGLLILDEVHVAPAKVFRKVLNDMRAHCKLGLTATLLREDEKIDELNYLIGPKLYEANWLDLSKNGFIANVQCAEVWCPMAPEFYREYLARANNARQRKLLYVMNPNKFRACQYLINVHEQRGDKIIVFSDDVYGLRTYAETLKKPFIYGPVSHQERRHILDNFQRNPACSCIFLSKVGDTSIDLPEATCLIQISSHFGSRRQEAQRLGRILRAKKRHEQGFNAYFYTLVSQDTQEMYYSSKRQQFLIDQGYAFHVITELAGMETMPGLVCSTKKDQIELLQRVLSASEDDLKDEAIETTDDIETEGRKSEAKRRKKMSNLSGGDRLTYNEYSRGGPSSVRDAFFLNEDRKKKKQQEQLQQQQEQLQLQQQQQQQKLLQQQQRKGIQQ